VSSIEFSKPTGAEGIDMAAVTTPAVAAAAATAPELANTEDADENIEAQGSHIDVFKAKKNLMARHRAKHTSHGSCCFRFGVPLRILLTLVQTILVTATALGVLITLLIAFVVVQ
jgi:hypothetical protein